MVNSTSCPLCPNGIGHAMDEDHARLVRKLVVALDAEHLQVVTLRDDVDWPTHLQEMPECPICMLIGKIAEAQ